jgi:hypothetical protein
MRQITEQAWEIIRESARFSDAGLAKAQILQYQARQMVKPMGPSMPLALHIGEKAVEPSVFLSPGEAIERHSGKLLSQRA